MFAHKRQSPIKGQLKLIHHVNIIKKTITTAFGLMVSDILKSKHCIPQCIEAFLCKTEKILVLIKRLDATTVVTILNDRIA